MACDLLMRRLLASVLTLAMLSACDTRKPNHIGAVLAPGDTLGPPFEGVHDSGEVYMDQEAAIWICRTGGTPGKWVNALSVDEAAGNKMLEAALFQDEIDRATYVFAHMMRSPARFDFLAHFLADHSKRYAILMKSFETERKSGNNFNWRGAQADPYYRFGDYLRNRVESDGEFAKKSALAWTNGWGITDSEVVARLRTKHYPGTRRIAIEYLKMENHGRDFGFTWQDEPETTRNRLAIATWDEWLKNGGGRTKP